MTTGIQNQRFSILVSSSSWFFHPFEEFFSFPNSFYSFSFHFYQNLVFPSSPPFSLSPSAPSSSSSSSSLSTHPSHNVLYSSLLLLHHLRFWVWVRVFNGRFFLSFISQGERFLFGKISLKRKKGRKEGKDHLYIILRDHIIKNLPSFQTNIEQCASIAYRYIT